MGVPSGSHLLCHRLPPCCFGCSDSEQHQIVNATLSLNGLDSVHITWWACGNAVQIKCTFCSSVEFVADDLLVHSALCLFLCLDFSIAVMLAQPSKVLIALPKCDAHTEMFKMMNDWLNQHWVRQYWNKKVAAGQQHVDQQARQRARRNISVSTDHYRLANSVDNSQ